MCFNPRTREGCDDILANGATGYSGFNPRTREGCDLRVLGCRAVYLGFNPRTREGCDFEPELDYLQDLLFQSTHPRGVRRDASKVSMRLIMFQSTHPRGVRQHSKKTKIYSTVEKQLPRTLIKMTKKTHITRLNTTKSLTSVTWRMECGLSNHFRFAL